MTPTPVFFGHVEFTRSFVTEQCTDPGPRGPSSIISVPGERGLFECVVL